MDPLTEEGDIAVIGLPRLCLLGGAGGELTTVAGAPSENLWIRYAHAYLGVHPAPLLSFHVKGSLRDTVALGRDVESHLDRRTDELLAQVGNPALTRYRLAVGRGTLPFGLNIPAAPVSYLIRTNSAFWDSPDEVAWATAEDREFLQFELGAATDSRWDRRGKPLPPKTKDGRDLPTEAESSSELALEKPIERAVAARLMVDLSALEGTRLVFSSYASTEGERRMGFGFVTVNHKEDATHFEFVRRLASPDGHAAPFEQLLRVGYAGAFRGNNRWISEFDDERFRHRMGILGYELRLWDHAQLRLGLTYFKSESGDNVRRWIMSSGVGATL